MKQLGSEILRVMFGLALFGLGNYLTICANVGLAPWVAFTMGLSQLSGIAYGNVSALIGLAVLGLDLVLKERIGIGTILNTLLVGKFVDLFQTLSLLPTPEGLPSGVALLLLGLLVNSVGSYYYMSGGLGCGPRDALMIALGKRLSRVPIGVVRSVIEATVLLCGWLLSAKIGIGTILSIFGIGFFIQRTFRFFHFHATEVHHESVAESLRRLKKSQAA